MEPLLALKAPTCLVVLTLGNTQCLVVCPVTDVLPSESKRAAYHRNTAWRKTAYTSICKLASLVARCAMVLSCTVSRTSFMKKRLKDLTLYCLYLRKTEAHNEAAQQISKSCRSAYVCCVGVACRPSERQCWIDKGFSCVSNCKNLSRHNSAWKH